MADLFSILQDFSRQLPGCKVVSIVDLESGMQLASIAGSLGAQAAGADAFHSELYTRMDGLVQALGAPSGPQSVVLESEDATFVSERIAQTGYIWHVVTQSTTTLGFVQAIMRKYRPRVNESVLSLVG